MALNQIMTNRDKRTIGFLSHSISNSTWRISNAVFFLGKKATHFPINWTKSGTFLFSVLLDTLDFQKGEDVSAVPI